MTKPKDDPAELTDEERAEAEEAAAWLKERLEEILAGRQPMKLSDVKAAVMEILSADHPSIMVEPGEVPGTLSIVVPKGMFEVITAFRAVKRRRVH